MIQNDIFKNADRILGIAYAFQNPLAMLHKIGRRQHNTQSGNMVMDSETPYTFSLDPDKKRNETKVSGYRGIIARRYREVYPHDYSADQISLQLNELDKVVNSYYSQNGDLLGLFSVIGDEVLHLRKDEIVIKFDALMDWNGYINKVDLNVIIGAFMARHGYQMTTRFKWYPPVDNSRLMNQLYSIGLAENHAHMKAAGYITELSWLAFLHTDLTNRSLDTFVQKGGLGDLRDQYATDELNYLLCATKCLRIMLETYLPEKERMFRNLLYDQKDDFKQMDEVRANQELQLFRKHLLSYILSSHGKYQTSIQEGQSLYNRVHDYFLSSNLPKWQAEMMSERSFWQQCFQLYARLDVNTDKDFRILLNMYLVCSNYIKQKLIQSNRGSGFDRFTDVEELKSIFLKSDRELRASNLDSIFSKYAQSGNLKKIELRVTPFDSASGYVRQIKLLQRAQNSVYKGLPSQNCQADFGLIVHFIKDEQLHGKKMSRSEYYRAYLESVRKQMRVLESFMTSPSYRDYQPYVVGMDTANLERDNPPELFGELYRHGQLIKGLQNFHFTYHVGESYNTLLDGMRHIFEVVFRLHFEDGDRLGHALALGQDVNGYYQTKRQLLITNQQSFLDDIAWMYWLCRFEKDEKFLPYLTGLFEDFSIWLKEIYQEPITLKDYVDFYCLRGTSLDYLVEKVYGVEFLKSLNDLKSISPAKRWKMQVLFDEKFIDKNNSAICDAVFNVRAVKLYYCYEHNVRAFEHGQDTITVQIKEPLLKLIQTVQQHLRIYLLEKGIAIEANPTSNAKISIEKYYAELQFLNLNRKGLSDDGTVDFPLSINTDDGAIFQTMLPYEYALVGKSLMIAGESPERVYSYLAYLQRSSISQSFILDRDKN